MMLKIRGMSISGNLLMGVNRFGPGLTINILGGYFPIFHYVIRYLKKNRN